MIASIVAPLLVWAGVFVYLMCLDSRLRKIDR